MKKIAQTYTRDQKLKMVRDRLEKKRRDQAMQAAAESGIGSAALTAGLNAVGSKSFKGPAKTGLITGGIVAPIAGAWSYLSNNPDKYMKRFTGNNK